MRMSFTLEKVVPWGRSFDEYVAMFALSPTDLQKRLLGCGDGPAAFNAELTRQGGRVLSVDPLYRFSTKEIRSRIDESYADVLAQTRANRHAFTWQQIKSVDELGQLRMAAMDAFLSDYALGAEQGRYVDGELPTLPCADRQFDLALCSHLLFLYSEQLTLDFHFASIRELSRVASEVRIFPLLELGSNISRHLQPILDGIAEQGYRASVVTVGYEFQRGGNQMLQIQAVQDAEERLG
jgi:hypothetical protein